jgi:hypothetical protein
MSGTTDFCVQWITAGAGQSSVSPSPWSTNYTNNGDHTAQSAAVGLNSSFSTPQWTNGTSGDHTGIGTAVCFK